MMPPYYDTPEMQQGRVRDIQRMTDWLRARYNPDNYIAVAYGYYSSLWNQLWNENTEDEGGCDDAQAPGLPTEKDGFVPPKNWDGKKVNSPKGRGYGWPDNKGNVWVPTGPKGHGGPHWDVQKRRVAT